MRKYLLMALMAVTTLTVCAQESEKKVTVIKMPTWVNNINFSGYGMLQYQGEDEEGKKHNEFNLRLARLALDGRIANDWYWKVQMQINGNTSTLGSSPRLVDLFAEWQKFKFARIKAGQFKRPFTFENPMHPITQGFMSYSQNVSKLAGFSDRTGEHASNGRDIGVQLQGDLIKDATGRELLHYQVGVFNGEGINKKDADNRKDIIGGIWVMPIKGMRIGAFGWTGSRKMAPTYTAWEAQLDATGAPVLDAAGNPVMEKKTKTAANSSYAKNRYALSAEYAQNDWTFRSEYIHSQGFGSNLDKGDKADGFYALCIAPIIKNKLHAKARYDVYREEKEWESSKTYYEIGADYVFTKNLQLNVEYALVNVRSNHKTHNLVDVELDFKF